ncbi:DUF3800 domain-containing protein [Flavobacterium supellecticarium]|uniref:DUF3800 domain-containing protein n=1 Tax=Flavobacterium supellecticarium TaxID=2565924 RepID=A0A4V3W8Y1_9FLAO|nr:DUF3800 domain-containing protein [Flavobacterium supellecticarium]THF53006.1 DUF3800 domain-containing protein [Flavobacterium supellecticarium]
MKIYIDESGNTGPIQFKNSTSNFEDQPLYVLAGLILGLDAKIKLEAFVNELRVKYKIQGNELKAKSLYESNFKFCEDLIMYLVKEKVPIFIELMDKMYFVNQHLVDYVFVPHYSYPVITDEIIFMKRFIASNLDKYINSGIYQSFLDSMTNYNNGSLEIFYQRLTEHLENSKGEVFQLLLKNARATIDEYYELKHTDAEKALKFYLPIPDPNPKGRLLFLLPNFNAFTNLLARAEKFNSTDEIDIIHDEQKQFDVIFESALKQMKEVEVDGLIKGTQIQNLVKFRIQTSKKLNFADSKEVVSLQVADLIAGIVMRYYLDFVNRNESNVKKYHQVMKMLGSTAQHSATGINYVIPDQMRKQFMQFLYS